MTPSLHIFDLKILKSKLFIVFIIFCTIFFYQSFQMGRIKSYITKTRRKHAIHSRKSMYSAEPTRNLFTDPLKYILLWTNRKSVPFVYFEEGNKVFINKKCKWTNCYVTANKYYLESYTDFDVIAFNGPQVPFTDKWPLKRSIVQKYVYASVESASNYPITNDQLNGVFNWTWTYKLDSDEVWGYFVVRDANNTVVAPSLSPINWIQVDNMDSNINESLKGILQDKKRAAVWFASNCHTMGGREDYIRLLQHFLRKFKMDVDIYGACGPRQCSKQIEDNCFRMVQKHYHFYLAFENSISEDYVTEKVIYALKNDAVPIVYGGANYSRFLPDGVYLNARMFTPMQLAKTMFNIIMDPHEYYKFFRWKKYYSFHFRNESPDTDEYCKFCANLNNKTLMGTYSVYDNLQEWWMRGQADNKHFINYLDSTK